MTDLAAAALRLAGEGFRVIPLRPRGKAPLVDDWPKRATTHAPQIEGWWRTWPTANVGIATGDGFLVIDLDAGGEETIVSLEANLGQLPPTRTVRTGSGGTHLYYSLPQGARVGNSVRQLGQGVDVRAEGGQVVAPPSVHQNGTAYSFIDDAPMAELPAAWLARLHEPARPQHSEPFSLEPGELVPEGQRDNTMFKLACSLRAKGLGYASILAAVSAENEARCRPPLPAEDVERIARSASKYEPGEANDAYVRRQREEQPAPPRALTTAPPEPAEPEPELPSFPVHCLPLPAAELVNGAAASVGVPVDMVGVPVLVAMATAIGGSRCLRVKADWPEYASLWAAVVAPPSSGKTPAMNAALAPLMAQQNKSLAKHRVAMGDWEQADQEWQGSKRNERGERPAKPIAERLIVDDFTVEKLAEILNENPRGLLAAQDELSGWVRSMNQYKSGGKGSDRAKYLSMWSSKGFTVDRKMNPIPLHVERPILSVIGGIQPAVLSELREHDDGFLERFLFTVQTDVLPPLWSDQEVHGSTARGWEILVQRLLGLDMVPGEYGAQPRPVSMTPPARKLFIQHYNAHMEAMRTAGLPEHLMSVYGKYQAQAARLALVLHCASYVLGDSGEWVEPRTVDYAWELATYFRDHATAAYGNTLSSPEDHRVDALKRWLARNGGKATTRDMTRKQVCGLKTQREALALVDRLVERGLGRVEEIAVRGGKRMEVTLF